MAFMRANGMQTDKLQVECILIVSQNAILIENLKQFHIDEYRVETAGSSYEAGEKYGIHQPRWVIIDFAISLAVGLTMWHNLRDKHRSCLIMLESVEPIPEEIKERRITDRHFIMSALDSHFLIVDKIKAKDHADYIQDQKA